MRVTTASCCASLRPKNAEHGPMIAKSFATTVVTPSKCSGRAAPQRPSVRSATWTVVSGRRGYISATLGVNTQSTPSAAAGLEVALEIARVAIEILVRAELQRVHEDRHDHEVGSRRSPPASATGARRAGNPIVGTRPTRRPEARASPQAARRLGDPVDVEHRYWPRSVPAPGGPDWRVGPVHRRRRRPPFTNGQWLSSG